MEATLTTRTIKIDGMTGEACVQKVKTALKTVPGITVDSVRVGSATIQADSDAKCNAACSAIKAAGYKASPEDSEKTDGLHSRETQASTYDLGAEKSDPTNNDDANGKQSNGGSPTKLASKPGNGQSAPSNAMTSEGADGAIGHADRNTNDKGQAKPVANAGLGNHRKS